MGATVWNEFTIDQPDTGMRPDSGHSVYSGFAKQLINLPLYVSFLLQRTSIFRPQNCLTYACCMKPAALR